MKKYFLILIILLAGVLRFWNLGNYPALNADEAAIGYNAYSLIETGKDEHGNPWPIHFQSFNDYKPGLYIYLVLPFVKILGLTEWAVRIPNALLGVATVYVLYFLVKELKIKNTNATSLLKLETQDIAAFMLAVSPWHIHFSRGGWEVNTSSFFITVGVLLFLKFVNLQKLWNLIFSLLFFAFSLYTYHASRIVAPLLGLGLLTLYFKDVFVKKNLKILTISLFFFLILVFPLVKDFMGPAGISRASGVGLFADQGPLSRTNEQRGEHISIGGFSGKLLHNKAINYTFAFIENWAKHFHGEFLFLSGDVIQRNKVPETGQMYILDFLWVGIGIAWMIRNSSKSGNLIFYWLAVAPVAAALTFQSPHALRAQNMIISLTIISAVGFKTVLDWLGKNITNKTLITICHLLLVTFVLVQFTRYEHMYWVHMSKEYPFSSQYRVSDLVKYVNANEQRFDKVVVTDAYDQPYILFLFYLKYPPQNFQKEHSLTVKDKYGFSTVREFSKYSFKKIEWDKVRDLRSTLLVGAEGDFVRDANITDKIYFPNGNVAFEIVPL